MIHVIKKIPRPPKEVVEGFRQVAPATAYEVMGKRGAMDTTIKPVYLGRGWRLCGPAVTVQSHIGDTLMVLKAITIAQAGDVIVADVGNSPDAVAWGGGSSLQAQLRGLAGCVTNGCARDGVELLELGFPVFAKGLSVKGTVKESLGLINHPLAMAGAIVYPGDIILGDDDGVVVVPRQEAEEVLRQSLEFEARHAESVERMKREGPPHRFALDEVLKAKGMVEEE